MRAVIGRQFAYDVAPGGLATGRGRPCSVSWDRLVEAEIVYQRGVPPQATYMFKHALIQDAAYAVAAKEHAAALPSADCPGARKPSFQRPLRRSQNCWRITIRRQVSRSRRFTIGIKLVKAPASAQPMWKPSATSVKGWRCSRRSPRPLSVLQREVDMHIALGASLIATKGYAAPEVGQTYTRARQLCQHLEDPHQLFPVLRGLWNYYHVRAELQTAHALGEQLLTLAQQAQDPAMLWRRTVPWGRRCSTWEQSPQRTRTLRRV